MIRVFLVQLTTGGRISADLVDLERLFGERYKLRQLMTGENLREFVANLIETNQIIAEAIISVNKTP